MSEKKLSTGEDLQALQRKVYLEYHQDGLVDCLLGLGMCGFGLMLLTDVVVFNLLAWIPLALYVPIKNAVTVPRFGYVRFDSRRSLRWGLIALAAGGLMLVLVLGFAFIQRSGSLPGEWQAFLETYHMLIVSGLLAVPLTLASAVTGLRRLLGYAAVLMLLTLLGIRFGIHPGLYFIALGLGVLGIGLVLLVRFLRRYPVRNSEAVNGG